MAGESASTSRGSRFTTIAVLTRASVRASTVGGLVSRVRVRRTGPDTSPPGPGMAARVIPGSHQPALCVNESVHGMEARTIMELTGTSMRWDDLDLGSGCSPTTAYAQSKLALVTYTCWLAARSSAPELEVVSMHAGVISTRLLHAMFSVGGDSPEAAADRIVAVASGAGDNGSYWAGTWIDRSS
jgi:NAD(P)-dependent dehydrogenase (short-subunit alcohol dehydrogenase family)